MQKIAVSVKKVSKDFKLPHQKAGSVKSVFTNIFSLGNTTYDVQHALKDIDFNVKEGEFFGIVGRNGSGKSTLLKIIAGIYQTSKGTVQVEGKLVPFIELGVGFNPELSGRENVYLNGALLGFSREEVTNKYRDIVEFAEISDFMDQKLKNYSSGMQVRLAFSVATVLAESDVLLIDEVLAVGDADFQRKCFRYFKSLKKMKKTVIFVTHDMSAVREYCDRAVLIDKQKIIIEGSPEVVARKYEKLLQPESSSDQGIVKSKKWGDETVIIKNPLVKKLTEENIIVSYDLFAKKVCEDPITGFSVSTADGVVLFGTNSRIEKAVIPKMRKSDTVSLEWLVPNIMSEGIYTITIAVQYDGGNTMSYWWEDAIELNISRDRKTPYSIQPKCNLKLIKAK